MKIFSSILHWSEIIHFYLTVFEVFDGNWGEIILKVHCLPRCNLQRITISNIKVYGWLTSFLWDQISHTRRHFPFTIQWMKILYLLPCNSTSRSLLKASNWRNWVFLAQVTKITGKLSQKRTPQMHMRACSLFFVVHFWEPTFECIANNRQFQE